MGDVMGVEPAEHFASFRHVRDMWDAAHTEPGIFRKGEQKAGGLIVKYRRYNLGGELCKVPGHIGIVTEAGEGPQVFIHANSLSGRVEEQPISHPETLLGYLAVDLG